MGKIVGRIFAAEQPNGDGLLEPSPVKTPSPAALSSDAARRDSFSGLLEPSPVKTPSPAARSSDAAGRDSFSALPEPSLVKRCEICGKEYKTEKGLAEHRAKEHPLDLLPEASPGDGGAAE